MEDENTITSGTAVRQIAVFLENQVGTLLSIVRLMNDHHVVVLGLSIKESTDATIVRLLVSDPDTVQALFMERGIPFSSTDLVVVELRHGAAGLADCLQALQEAETNINFAYPVLSQPNDHSALALSVEDAEFGSSVLLAAGFKLLYQEDLSR
ncbi:MAG: acetolactate synthase [Verrucomicrobiales bacterium]|nr:acetolactate synthase [Verrucomicrobiales bacterium]